MAKVRKLTFSLSERFLYSNNHGHGTAMDTPSDLREDDVWSTVNDDRHIGESNEEHASRSKTRRHLPCVDRKIGGLALVFDDVSGKATSSSRIIHQFRGPDSPRGRHMATSAPVNVPDWSKIYRADSVESLHDTDDVDESDLEMIPPHEYLSRKLAANSVLKGVGRTLKGRDMSRVRDAVWSQTGYDG